MARHMLPLAVMLLGLLLAMCSAGSNVDCEQWGRSDESCSRMKRLVRRDLGAVKTGAFQACYFVWPACKGDSTKWKCAIEEFVSYKLKPTDALFRKTVDNFWALQGGQGCVQDPLRCPDDCGCHNKGDCSHFQCSENCNNHFELIGNARARMCTWSSGSCQKL